MSLPQYCGLPLSRESTAVPLGQTVHTLTDRLDQIPDNPAAPVRGENVVDLTMNENPEPPLELLRSPPMDALAQVNRYPVAAMLRLRRRLADLHQVTPDQVAVLNGATEAIWLLPRSIEPPGAQVLLPACTFPEYRNASIAAGLAVCEVHMRTDLGIDLPALAARVTQATRLIFLANPNNPTGGYFTHAELSRFLATIPASVLVVLDEAYRDYAQGLDLPDSAALLTRHRNLAVLRTFSKSYGLAALRVAYMLGDSQQLNLLERVRLPFSGNLFGYAAAYELLGCAELLPRVIARNRVRRALLEQEMAGLGLVCHPSVANFMIVDTPLPGSELAQQLRLRGVLVRPLDRFGFSSSVRISVGTESQIERLSSEVRAVVNARVAG